MTEIDQVEDAAQVAARKCRKIARLIALAIAIEIVCTLGAIGADWLCRSNLPGELPVAWFYTVGFVRLVLLVWLARAIARRMDWARRTYIAATCLSFAAGAYCISGCVRELFADLGIGAWVLLVGVAIVYLVYVSAAVMLVGKRRSACFLKSPHGIAWTCVWWLSFASCFAVMTFMSDVESLRMAALFGDEVAQYNLGVCYENGDGVAQSPKEAVRWYSKAARNGDADAQYALAWYYETGNVVTQSVEIAAKLYRMAADQGNVGAQFKLGGFYLDGKGVERSDVESVKWYHKAAEQGNAGAQFCLGVCYFYGNGVEQSYEEAVKWLRRGAELGDADSQMVLGTCYAKGKGVTQSLEEAVKWFRKAADQENADAKAALEVLEEK